jgi:inner membrane protein
MPTLFTHAAVGLGLGKLYADQKMPGLFWALSATLSMLPDIDVLAFSLGIPYGAVFGHRGFAHSFSCALIISLAVSLLVFEACAVPWWHLWAFFFVVMASHGVLDAFTNGGMGIAFFAPFDNTRYFFPWSPIQVSPLGLGFFSKYGLRVMLSEVLWVWLPMAAVVATVTVYRVTRTAG